MLVPFNDLRRGALRDREALLAAMTTVVESGWFVLGGQVAEFEEAFGVYLGGRSVVGVANGTDALELCLRAAGVREGDEVVTVANAGGYTSTACHAIGAVPRYVDVGSDLLIDPAAVPTVVSSRTRAIVVTHLYGQVADVAAVRAAAPEGVLVVEDCAQAHGAHAPAGMAGTLGDLAAFSFYPTKNLGCLGDGGAVAAEDPILTDRVRSLRAYGWEGKYDVALVGGRNSRLDELQAAVLNLRLAGLDAANDRRRAIARAYRETRPDLGFVGPLEGNVHHLCVVQVPDREGVRAALRSAGVATDVHYPVPDHRQRAWVGDGATRLPVTERACAEVLSLPCFPELSDDEVAVVVDALARLP